jgi:trafficking protein particle complex subunit 6
MSELTIHQREAAESAFEYLLGEILNLSYPLKANDQNAAVIQRLDSLGYEVGYRLIAKVSATTKFIGSDPLDLVKFICKEFWEDVFKKKVDKLQTNHRGVFVLSDLKFRWLEKYSSDDMASKQAAVRMLHFPCGMIRGALANLGALAIINADFNTLPACTFNIRIKT